MQYKWEAYPPAEGRSDHQVQCFTAKMPKGAESDLSLSMPTYCQCIQRDCARDVSERSV